MKMPPEVLRLSGDSSSATFKRLWQRLWLATMIFRKWSSTMPRSPGLGLPPPPFPESRPLPSCQFWPRSAWYALGNRPLPSGPMQPRPRHTAQDGTKSRTWCKSLPRPKNGPYKLCTVLKIVVLCATYAVTALAIPHKPIMQANGKCDTAKK